MSVPFEEDQRKWYRRAVKTLLVLCFFVGTLHADPKPACDAERLADAGRAALVKDKFAEALGWFEQSLACKSDPGVVTLALNSACKGGDAPKARKYYKLATDIKHRDKVVKHCLKNNIDPTKD
jgi:hypothetical protein